MPLDPRARAMLREYRRETTVPRRRHAQVWDRIDASLDAEPARDRPRPAPRSHAGWIALTVAAVAAAVVIGVALRPRVAKLRSPQIAPTEAVDRARGAKPMKAEPRSPRPAPASTQPLPAPPSMPATSPLPAKVDRPQRGTAARGTPARPRPTLRDELAVIRAARRSVRDHDPNQALAMLRAHARDFPQGQMIEDRQALRIRALCQLGRNPEATTAAAAFAKRFPSSAHDDLLQECR